MICKGKSDPSQVSALLFAYPLLKAQIIYFKMN